MDEAYDDLMVFVDKLIRKYNVSNDDIAYMLMQLGVNYYFKSIVCRKLNIEEREEKDEQ